MLLVTKSVSNALKIQMTEVKRNKIREIIIKYLLKIQDKLHYGEPRHTSAYDHSRIRSSTVLTPDLASLQ